MPLLSRTPIAVAAALALATWAAACSRGADEGVARREALAAGGAVERIGGWSEAAPLPAPVTNNAVAADASETTLADFDIYDPLEEVWSSGAPIPVTPRYRMHAAAAPFGGRVIFAGGTSSPYNYDGVGCHGEPSRPSDAVFAFDAQRGVWEEAWPPKPLASMDQRAFAVLGDKLFVIGGMLPGQRVTARVQLLELGGG